MLLVPDVTGDGKADILARVGADGSTQVRPGDGAGGFGQPVAAFGSLAGHDLVTVAGDLDGDGHTDLVARDAATGRLDAYLGNGQSGFTVKQLGDSWGKYNLVDGPGDVNGDGRPDLVARGTEGAFYLVPGIGGVGFGTPVRIRGNWTGYDTITGHGDFNGDGKVDLLVRATGSSQVYVKPNRGNGRFGHALGTDQRPRRPERAQRGCLRLRRPRPRPAGAQRRHPAAVPQPGDLRDRHADRHGSRPAEGRGHPQRRGLGP